MPNIPAAVGPYASTVGFGLAVTNATGAPLSTFGSGGYSGVRIDAAVRFEVYAVRALQDGRFGAGSDPRRDVRQRWGDRRQLRGEFSNDLLVTLFYGIVRKMEGGGRLRELYDIWSENLAGR